MIGHKLGHYRIVEKIGAGGMGEVYRAHDEQLDRDVALKVLPSGTIPDEAARKQFRKEALALAKLNHPNIETVHEFGTQEGVDFLAMELIAGSSLNQKLKGGPLDEKEIVRLGMQFAGGLAAAHERGLVHRDLKPANVMVTPEGWLKILDFGLAKLIHQDVFTDITRSITIESGRISGTVPYMAPEQLRGLPVDPRADIYAAGAVLYEMTTGRRPFPQLQSAELMGAILHESPAAPSSINPRIAPGLDSAILKALEKEPSQRYQSARELLVALEGISHSAVVSTSSAPSASTIVPAALPGAGPLIPRARRYRWLLAASAGVVAALTAAASLYLHRAPKLTERDTIVLADFTNTTGDTVFDGTLRQGLSVQLEQSPFLSIIADQKIQQALQMMDQKPDAKITPEVARELCQRTGSAAVLDGSIAQIGTQYLLTLKAVNCESGDSLASTDAQASDKNHVLDALGKTASQMRSKLGESLSTVRKFDTPLEQATTPSLEALKALSTARTVLYTSGEASAIPFFKRAVELDPNFALAYAYLGIMETTIGEPRVAGVYTSKAYELRDRTSEAEKYFIIAAYQKEVTGNIHEAVQACKLWIQAYPRTEMPHGYLAGAVYPVIGEYEKAVEESKEAIRLAPDNPIPYAFLIFNETSLNRLDEAKAAYAQSQTRKLNSPFYPVALYEIDFLENDADGMAKQLSAAASQPGAEDGLLSLAADTAAYSGRLKDARELSRRAMDSAERAQEKESATTYLAISALRESLFGNAEEARRRASSAISRQAGRDALYGAALVYAYIGDNTRSHELTDELAKEYPEDTLVQVNYLPTLRAKLALNRGNTSEAFEALRAAEAYELGGTTSSMNEFTSMYPVYVRGEAYLGAHRGSEAAAEFQKILEYRGIVLNEPVGALAHLGLARAYAIQGDSAKGRAAYKDFLTLWKDADPDIPVLQQAKAEYAKLQ
jgi:serine/threonine protein kinase